MSPQDDAPLPLPPKKWNRIAKALKLAPQHKRIAELILRKRCDKQIAAELGLGLPTVRTYVDRMFRRTGVSDRVELILLILRMSQDSGDR